MQWLTMLILMYKQTIRLLVLVMLCFHANADIPIATDNRIKTYVYNPNDIYLVLMQSGFQTSVEFERGEKIKTLSLGSSYSWTITPVGNRLFIKPLEDTIRTNMTVITSKRTYQFDLVSKHPDESDLDIAYVVRFFYPLKQ